MNIIHPSDQLSIVDSFPTHYQVVLKDEHGVLFYCVEGSFRVMKVRFENVQNKFVMHDPLISADPLIRYSLLVGVVGVELVIVWGNQAIWGKHKDSSHSLMHCHENKCFSQPLTSKLQLIADFLDFLVAWEWVTDDGHKLLFFQPVSIKSESQVKSKSIDRLWCIHWKLLSV